MRKGDKVTIVGTVFEAREDYLIVDFVHAGHITINNEEVVSVEHSEPKSGMALINGKYWQRNYEGEWVRDGEFPATWLGLTQFNPSVVELEAKS